MNTEMDDVAPGSATIELVSGREVRFRFDLNKNPKFRDQELVRRSMAGYMLKYSRLHGYQALYLEDYLVLTVTGDINQETLTKLRFG